MPRYRNTSKNVYGKYDEIIEPRDYEKDLYVQLKTDGTNLILIDENPLQNPFEKDFQIDNTDFTQVDSTSQIYEFNLPIDIQDEKSIKITPFFNSTVFEAVDSLKIYFDSLTNEPGMSFYQPFVIRKLAGRYKTIYFKKIKNIEVKIHIQVGHDLNIT